MQVEICRETSWKRALNEARRTQGKEPLDKEPSKEWRLSMLFAEHSPIRLVEYRITFRSIKQWITVHLVRHWLGWIPFVHSQRDDRRDNPVPRDELPQGALNDADFIGNAQALINISKLRLCSCASSETRAAWAKVKEEMQKVDPEMASVMVKNCIYRGFCPERESCGYYKTEAFKKELQEYRSLINRE